jgi:hypothetical protein
MSNLIRNYTADGATSAYRIAKPGSDDGLAAQASAATDALFGIFDELAHDDGERADVIRAGACLIQLGGTVTRGDWLTANSDGKAVKAAPDAGSNVSVIGRAEVSGKDADIVPHILAIGQIQG